MGKRSRKVWENKFKCVKKLMEVMDDFGSDKSLVECCSTMLRNPVVFDNNIKEVKNYIPYTIKDMESTTEDHLIGMSNMVLYMFKKGLHKKWNTVDDFKKTLRSLNILLPVTKSLNDNGVFKTGWKFGLNNVEDCIKWDNKLKSVGITHLVCNDTNELISVDDVWNTWYESNKKYL